MAELDWILVASLGALVGVGELVARYRDRLHRALVQGPTLFYMVINSVAAVVALILNRTFGWNFRLAAEATPAELRSGWLQAEVRIYRRANGSEREQGRPGTSATTRAEARGNCVDESRRARWGSSAA